MRENHQSRQLDQKLLSVRDVARRYGKSKCTIWRWIADGVLPDPVRLTPKTVGWWVDDLREWEETEWPGGGHAA